MEAGDGDSIADIAPEPAFPLPPTLKAAPGLIYNSLNTAAVSSPILTDAAPVYAILQRRR